MSSDQQRTVLITGATGSVGQALTRRFADEGYVVTAQYNSATEEAKSLEAIDGVTTQQLDLENFERRSLEYDVLINNAGINISDELTADVTDDLWNRTLALNLTAPFRLVQDVLPYMVDQKWGRIINISSIHGLRGTLWNLPYNVSKHGLSALTKSVAKEYASYGVSCNEICPGPIKSAMLEQVIAEDAEREGVGFEDHYRTWCAEIPAGRMAESDEVAAAALYLASDGAAYTNGSSLVVDGGWIS